MTKSVELVKKVCLIGDPGVGKTSLIRRYVLDQFDDAYLSTIGAKVTKKTKLVDVPENDLKLTMNLMIWDVAGQKEYLQFHEMYLKGMEGVISVCDVTRKNTVESLKGSITMVNKHAGEVPIVFLLNKCDLVDPASINLKDIELVAVPRGIPILPTSAKNGLNVEEAFERLCNMIARRWINYKLSKM